MAKNLVIVESPAKVKTIKKFLGSNYEVDASGGHVRDLPKSTLGVDVEHGYEPKYITIRGKGDVLARLRKEVKKADKIYLATDPDREGEAISWHLMKALKLDEQKDKKVYRISFNEITKNAVKASLKEPRAIDENLVDAQQARRMLDRMVGYLISPLLWAKVKRGLSAGRVQSVALRMICDREEEINAFIPEEYWTLDAKLHVHGSRKKLTAHYYGDKDGRKAIHSKEEVEAMIDYTVEAFGKVDVVINNAGISYIGLLQDMSPEEWDRIVRTNLTSVFNCSKLAIPHMLEQKSGKILNISSVWGNVGASCEVAYSATKGGINSFTRALAKELAPSNVQVNAVACGAIDTDMNHFLEKEELEALKEEIPAGRLAKPEEVAQLLLQLARSDSYLTGQIIGFDGGWI